tara:strand:- start:736 stop:1941 length:1206 start_codon:yes stop_codon:yes gene_type:complete
MITRYVPDEEFNDFLTNHIVNLEAVLKEIKISDEETRIRFTWKEHVRTLWDHIKEYADFCFPDNLTEAFLRVIENISHMNIAELRLDGESKTVHILVDSKDDIYISNNTAFLSSAIRKHEDEESVGAIELPFKVWIQTKPDGTSKKTADTWKIIDDWKGEIAFSVVIGSDEYTVYEVETGREKYVSYDIINRSGIEDFGLDDETLISVERLEGLNLHEIYDKIYKKNDISENNEWWTSRMTDDLISILTDESRGDSFGYIELAHCFEPREVPSIDVLVGKKISVLPVPPPEVFKLWPDIAHHFFEIVHSNTRLKKHQKISEIPITIMNDLREILTTKVSNYLDNEANPDTPTRFLGSPGKERPEDGAGRRIDGVSQIIMGWKEIPVHEKHPRYHEYRKRLD